MAKYGTYVRGAQSSKSSRPSSCCCEGDDEYYQYASCREIRVALLHPRSKITRTRHQAQGAGRDGRHAANYVLQ